MLCTAAETRLRRDYPGKPEVWRGRRVKTSVYDLVFLAFAWNTRKPYTIQIRGEREWTHIHESWYFATFNFTSILHTDLLFDHSDE